MHLDRGRQKNEGATATVGAGAFELAGLVEKNIASQTTASKVAEAMTLTACILLLAPAVLACAVLIHIYVLYPASRPAGSSSPDGNFTGSVFTQDPLRLSEAVGHTIAAPLVATLFSLACAPKAARRRRACLPSAQTVLIWVFVLDMHAYSVALIIFEERLTAYVHYYFRMTFAVALLTISLRAIAIVDDVALAFVNNEDEAIRRLKERRKAVAIMKTVGAFGPTDPKKEEAYSFTEHSTAADVLVRMWTVLRNAARALIFIIFTMFYMSSSGDALNESPEFSWAEILFFAILCLGSMTLYLGCSSDAVRSVLHIALTKPFFLGDIVHVHKGDAPGGLSLSICGFVENFTFSHVVLRSFDVKQVWITYQEFLTLNVSNWTRRPNKCVNFKLHLRPSDHPKAVKALLKFIKAWVGESPDVKQSGYKKIALTNVDPGYQLTVIFFTGVGVSKKKMREKLLFAMFEAARRLRVTFVAETLPAYEPPPVGSMGEAPTAELTLDDLLPEPTPPPAPPPVPSQSSVVAPPTAAH